VSALLARSRMFFARMSRGALCASASRTHILRLMLLRRLSWPTTVLVSLRTSPGRFRASAARSSFQSLRENVEADFKVESARGNGMRVTINFVHKPPLNKAGGVLNGISWVLRSDAPWHDLLQSFGPYTPATTGGARPQR
jgi:hypothetical protein